MKTSRTLITLALVLILALSLFLPVHAAGNQNTTYYLRQLIFYYMHYQEDARTDIDRVLAQLSETDPVQAEAWTKIMDFWSYANSEMDIPTGELPDGLPEDDSLCIVVLGYALGPYGGIKPELSGRLEVALKSAEKYPNAYILCTGGATASRVAKTEAGQMADWLEKHGIASERIIVEDKAFSTVENAEYGCRILSEEYPQVKHLALISSDYHIPRGCVYFYTQSVISAYKSGTPELDIIACAALRTNRKEEESMSSSQAQGIGQITGVNISNGDKPVLSKLTDIEVDSETTYYAGTATELTVTAHYNTDFSREVTASAVFSGVDMNVPGEQLLTVSYTENGVTATADLLLDIVANPAVSDNETAPASEATQPASALTASSGETAPLWPFLLLAFLLALLAFLIRLKISRR